MGDAVGSGFEMTRPCKQWCAVRARSRAWSRKTATCSLVTRARNACNAIPFGRVQMLEVFRFANPQCLIRGGFDVQEGLCPPVQA